jgi:hypothetical protein
VHSYNGKSVNEFVSASDREMYFVAKSSTGMVTGEEKLDENR